MKKRRDEPTAPKRRGAALEFHLGHLVGALLLAVPALLGAKGCELVDLGSDEIPCSSSEECESGSFCLFAAGDACGDKGAFGTCSILPEACTREVNPVCGCDDRTYGNACEANAAGVSVASKGACDEEDPLPTGECGGLQGLQCDEGEFCNYPIEATCGAADQMGACELIPEVCADVYDPVCGCDDQTYSNECTAHGAGVSVQKEGACDEEDPVTTKCDSSADCLEDQVCSRPDAESCADFAEPGVCEQREDVACILLYDPVCGCDGETYGNSCSAGAAGMLVDYEGECQADEPVVCGGLLGQSCDEDEFCNYPSDAMCGFADATGVCEAMPEGCTKEYDPVCGCDGNTYGNACSANSAGVSVAHEGECDTEPKPEICGGLTGESCTEGFFCRFDEAAMCGAADATGTCEATPQACDAVFDPVCGCDDKTYGNECEAHLAGISVSHGGECELPQWDCGSLAGLTCDEGEFCNYENYVGCVPDGVGLCEVIPEACTLELKPVCGCDGETYGNGCEAHAAGVSILHDGECE